MPSSPWCNDWQQQHDTGALWSKQAFFHAHLQANTEAEERDLQTIDTKGCSKKSDMSKASWFLYQAKHDLERERKTAIQAYKEIPAHPFRLVPITGGTYPIIDASGFHTALGDAVSAAVPSSAKGLQVEQEVANIVHEICSSWRGGDGILCAYWR